MPLSGPQGTSAVCVLHIHGCSGNPSIGLLKALRAVRRARRLDSFLEAFWMLGAPHFGSIPAFRGTFEVTFCTFGCLWGHFWSNLQLLGALWGHFGLICSVKKRTGAPKVPQERPRALTPEIRSPIWGPFGGILFVHFQVVSLNKMVLKYVPFFLRF